MKPTSKARYGLKAVCYLAGRRENGAVPLHEIALSVGVGQGYLEQLMMLLRKSGIIGAKKGAGGGYYLLPYKEDITVGEVMHALDEDFSYCSDPGDPSLWITIDTAIKDIMNKPISAYMKESMPFRRIYLDHAATTAVDNEVFEKMKPYFCSIYGNASSQHSQGREALMAVDEAREKIADAFNVRHGDIYFTAGGSESDNWAIKGVAHAYADKGKHIITSSIEHPAVMNTCASLEKEGFKVTYLKVDKRGIIDTDELKRAIRPDTVLISVMTANNELGSIMPIKKIGEIAHDAGVIFHTDAVQAAGVIPIDAKALNIDLLSISGHKFYGPKGVGALYKRNGVKCDRLIDGGEQERGRRAGTLNTTGIVGMGYAIEKAVKDMSLYDKKVRSVCDGFVNALTTAVKDVHRNGADSENRLPGIASLTFDRVDARALLMLLDVEGISVSGGSACSSGTQEPSYVLRATGMSDDAALSTLRFSFGRENNTDEIPYIVEKTAKAVASLRETVDLFARADTPDKFA